MPDEPGRHRVLIAAHHDLGVPVHPRGQRQRRIERLARQRAQQRLLERPVLPNTVGAVGDPARVIGVISSGEQLVELFDGVDHRHRDAVVASEPAALALHAALLVAAVMTGLAVERVETVVGAERDPPFGLCATARTAPG